MPWLCMCVFRVAKQTSSALSPPDFSTLCWLPFSYLPKCVAGKYLLCGLRRYLTPVCPGSHFSALNIVLSPPTPWGVQIDRKSQGHGLCAYCSPACLPSLMLANMEEEETTQGQRCPGCQTHLESLQKACPCWGARQPCPAQQ